MIGQYLADGLVLGATLALGAIVLTLTYDILRFANFAHSEFLTFGAYFALVFGGSFAGVQTIGPLSFGLGFVWAIVAAAFATAALALVLDWILFRPLRRSGIAVTLVIASFGASLMLRNVVVFAWGPEPRYYARAIAIAEEIVPGVRVTPDEVFVVALAAALMLALHLFLSRTRLGRAMRAVSDDPALASVAGIDVRNVIRATWIVGAALAAVAGVLFGLTVQVLPDMGATLILSMFAAAILGGVGSVYGAVLGALVIGLVQSLSVAWIGPAYKPGVAFVAMLLALLFFPRGLLGARR